MIAQYGTYYNDFLSQSFISLPFSPCQTHMQWYCGNVPRQFSSWSVENCHPFLDPPRTASMDAKTPPIPPLFIFVKIIMDFGGRSIVRYWLLFISPLQVPDQLSLRHLSGNRLDLVLPTIQFQSLKLSKLTHSALSFFPQPRCRDIIDGLRNLQDQVKKVLAQDKKIRSIAEKLHTVFFYNTANHLFEIPEL